MGHSKPFCGRCNEEIVGVIPQWDGEIPVCRNCAYSGTGKRSARVPEEGQNGPGENGKTQPQSRIGPGVGTFVLIAGLVIIGMSAGNFISALEPDRPQYRGAKDLDSVSEACIENLWKITRLIQDGALQWPKMNCPATGQPYRIVHKSGDTEVSCPSPGKHNVSRMWVSRKSPVPEVEL